MPKGKTDDQFPDLDAFDSKPMKNKAQMSEPKKYEEEVDPSHVLCISNLNE